MAAARALGPGRQEAWGRAPPHSLLGLGLRGRDTVHREAEHDFYTRQHREAECSRLSSPDFMFTCRPEWMTVCELRSSTEGVITHRHRQACPRRCWHGLHFGFGWGWGFSYATGWAWDFLSWEGGTLNFRAFFMVDLIFLVTTNASIKHRTAAVRHKICQTQDHRREGKVGLLCSSAPTPQRSPNLRAGAVERGLPFPSPSHTLWCLPCLS